MASLNYPAREVRLGDAKMNGDEKDSDATVDPRLKLIEETEILLAELRMKYGPPPPLSAQELDEFYTEFHNKVRMRSKTIKDKNSH
jgi:hypothetical protein